MAYSTAQIDSFRNKLTSLKSTRTKLPTNRMPVKTVIDGDVVQYHLYDIPFLTSRINELEAINDIAHVFRPERPGQARGASWLAPILASCM